MPLQWPHAPFKVKVRTEYIEKSNLAQSWNRSTIPLLVVNGHEPQDGPHSPVSLYAQRTMGNLQGRLPGPFLAWFCSTHPHQNAKDVAVALLGQLLEIGTREEDNTTGIQVLASKRPKGVSCKEIIDVLVKACQQQLKKEPIFLLIDSISLYESEGGDDLQYLIDSLISITGMGTGRVFKITITSPTMTKIGAKHSAKTITINCPNRTEFMKIEQGTA